MRLASSMACALTLQFAVVLAAEPTVYLGNLHSHTSYSDGSGTPHDAFRHAREAAKLDFLAVTEHNHAAAESGAGDRRDGILIATDPSLYNGADPFSLVETAKRMTEDGKFVALYGQEFSSISKGNHVCVFDAPSVITTPNGRFDSLLGWYVETFRGTVGGSPATVIDASTIDGIDNTPDDVWTIDNVQYQGGLQFVFLKITQHDEDGHQDRLWTSPVWLVPATVDLVEAGGAAAPQPAVVASRSNVDHTWIECEFAQAISRRNRVLRAEAQSGRRQCLKCKEHEADAIAAR